MEKSTENTNTQDDKEVVLWNQLDNKAKCLIDVLSTGLKLSRSETIEAAVYAAFYNCDLLTAVSIVQTLYPRFSESA